MTDFVENTHFTDIETDNLVVHTSSTFTGTNTYNNVTENYTGGTSNYDSTHVTNDNGTTNYSSTSVENHN